MAVYGEHIWQIDAADAAADAITLDHLYLKAVRWVSKGASAGDDAEIRNSAGDLVWSSVATGANYVEESAVPFRIAGLIVPVLDSGSLFLYHSLTPNK